MSKQRRAARARTARPRRRRKVRVSTPPRRPPAAVALSPPPPAAGPAVDKKPSYLEAVATYERGVAALQQRAFGVAAERFREVLDRYPDERELHERARLFLRVCERELERRQPVEPRTPEERLFAATLALNAGRDEEAFGHLTQATADDPANGTAHYMLAIVLVRRGDAAGALDHLARAIELDAEHRLLARREADFDGLRDDPAFQALVEPPVARPAGRRVPRRPRPR